MSYKIQARLPPSFETRPSISAVAEIAICMAKSRRRDLMGAPQDEGERADGPDAEVHLLEAGPFAMDEAADEGTGLVRAFLGRL